VGKKTDQSLEGDGAGKGEGPGYDFVEAKKWEEKRTRAARDDHKADSRISGEPVLRGGNDPGRIGKGATGE